MSAVTCGHARKNTQANKPSPPTTIITMTLILPAFTSQGMADFLLIPIKGQMGLWIAGYQPTLK